MATNIAILADKYLAEARTKNRKIKFEAILGDLSPFIYH